MFLRQRLSLLPLSLAAILSAGLALTLTGCGMSGGGSTAATSVNAAVSTTGFGGRVHGGQQAVTGATVKLWAAGTTGASPAGYGANATAIATTTTDSNGNFSFNNTSGVSPCTTGQYLYITSTGGNSGSGTNAQLALMAALPTPCSAATGGTYVFVNELTTVAAVTALQQFMSIAPGGATPWTIGAPSTNLVGLANAFLTTGNLVSIATGQSAASTTSNAISNTVGGVLYTTIVDPDYQKLNTLADILAYCVNSAGGSTCTGLFSDMTPSGATAPTDTIQAMYYVATNPGGLTMPAHGNALGSPSYLCGQYPSSNSPFEPTSTCTGVYDWTISVKLKTTNPSAATVGTAYPASIGIDSQGNVWVGVGTGGAAPFINQFSPLGALNIYGPTTVNLPASTLNLVVGNTSTAYAYTGDTGLAPTYGRPFSLAVDTLDNAFSSSFGPAITPSTAGTSTTMPVGLITEVSSTGLVTPILSGSASGALAIDGNNNIWMNNIPYTARYYFSELLSGNGYTTLNEGGGRLSSTLFNYVMVDGSASQFGIAFSSSTTCTNFLVQRATTTDEATQPLSPTTTPNDLNLPSNCAAYGAVDAANNIWATYGGALNYLNIAAGTAGSGTTATVPVVTTIASSTNTTTTAAGGTGGVDYPAGVAVDGTGKVWTVNRPTSTFTGISEFSVATSGGTTTATALSPSGAGIFGFQSGAISGANGLAIDRSGNLWVMATSGSYLYYIVGAASPVITPMSAAIAAGKLGVRP
ncbi:hypothetical protein SAMN05421770_11236 [Granulicella rosea]|uniref:Uncharacterized protein n=1 Tax=Granulicella rosea TaxID=474952 RepID=A0A239MFH4_9BACT|nr:hypothetical protein [Granulicella rosea]SNT41455.1 hypothetical protein SAMN05421770_11236 [Granulicella rosea]